MVSLSIWKLLNEVVDECHDIALSSGWWEGYNGDDLSPDETALKLYLIHSEVSEALEDVRNGNLDTCYTLKVNGAEKETVTVPMGTVNAKPEGLPSELADIVIRVFDLCGYMGIDIADAMRIKMNYNKTRGHRHGGKRL